MNFLKKSILLGFISGLSLTAEAQTTDTLKNVPQNQKKVKNVIIILLAMFSSYFLRAFYNQSSGN